METTRELGFEPRDLYLGELGIWFGLIDRESMTRHLATQRALSAEGFRIPIGWIFLLRRAMSPLVLYTLLRTQARARGGDPDAVGRASCVRYARSEQRRAAARIRSLRTSGPAIEWAMRLERSLELLGIVKHWTEILVDLREIPFPWAAEPPVPRPELEVDLAG